MTLLPPSEQPEDRDRIDLGLMQRIARGDRVAYSELYNRFSGPLYGTALRMLRQPAEAQDIVHDAFMAVWEKAGTYETSRGSVFSWVLTLVRNRAIDRLRMLRRRSGLIAGAAASDVEHLMTAPVASPQETADAADEAKAVRAAVAALPTEQHRALELAFFGGLTQEQIAAKLGEPLGTVKARIRRGLLKLKETLTARQ